MHVEYRKWLVPFLKWQIGEDKKSETEEEFRLMRFLQIKSKAKSA